MRRNYLILVEVLFQPNVLEKLAGFLRRRNYEYRRIVFTKLSESSAIILIEASCSDYELEQLIKNYQNYPEVVRISFHETFKEILEEAVAKG